MTKFEITEVITRNKRSPVIVNFENGKLCEGQEQSLSCKRFELEKDLVLAVASNRMLYTSQISEKDGLFQNFIVAHSKNTQKVRLIEVDYALLRPNMKKDEMLSLNSTVVDNYNASNAELNKQFGSKRIKRQTEQRERLQMNIENIKDDLEQTVAAVDLGDGYLEAPQSEDSSYRPHINRNASTKEQVYELENIVSQNVLDGLTDMASTIFDNLADIDLKPFCKHSIVALQNTDSEKNLQKCKIFLLINYLVTFLSTPAKSITKKFTICDTSAEVNSYILDNFSTIVGNHRTRPLSMRDKGICYVLVLAMIACDYKLNLEMLAKDLKLGLKKVQEISRVLAFTPSGDSAAVLKLPLPAPVTNNSKRKRKN